MKRLEKKVIVITGAGMGLGLATAIEAAKNGARLSLVDYDGDALEKAKAQILKAAGAIQRSSTDFCRPMRSKKQKHRL